MRTDVVVVGLGPAGIVAARVLAQAGLSVTALQARTPEQAGRAALVSPAPTVRRCDSDVAMLSPTPQAGADRLGGSKNLAAPQSYRLDEWALRARSATESRYGAAAIPSGADLSDWPLLLGELNPYYERVEHLMRVGSRAATEWTATMTRAAASLGWAPFAAPAAAETDASPLLHDSGVRIRRGTALSVLTGSTGEVRGVEYLSEEGVILSLSCGAVVIAASVIPTIRLLLLSGIDANGQLGRYFMSHNSFVTHGLFPGVDLGRDGAGPATAVAVSEFESDRFDHFGLGFLGGSILQAAMTGPRSDGWRAAVADSLPDGDSSKEGRALVATQEASIGTVWAQPDQLPRWSNRVDLDPSHTDASGRPVARVTFDLAADDRRRWEFLGDRMAQWLAAAGAERRWTSPLLAQPLGTHLYGGARMGMDPASSVVDGYGRCHTVPGLVVVGSSTFPSTGGRGPVETIEALAWRSAVRLASDLR